MKRGLFVLIAASLFGMAHADDTITSVISKKPVRLYATAQDMSPQGEVAPAELTSALPLPVLAEEGERIRFAVAGKPVWASSIAFKIHRDCKVMARVAPKDTRNTAAIRGVGNEGGCTK